MLNKRWVRVALYMIIAALFLGGLLITVRQNVLFQENYEAPPTPAPTVVITPAPETDAPEETPVPTPYVKPIPTKVYFTDYEISAVVVPVNVVDGAMETLDSADDVAWLGSGVAPGEAGNALLNGHVTWKKKAGTFSILRDKLKPGDEIAFAYQGGNFQYFEVVSVETFLLDEFPDAYLELDIGGEPRVTMITCLGDWDAGLGTSRSRVVAIAKPK